MTDEEKTIIVDVLCGQALADHLGDVRDAERQLWGLIGVTEICTENDSAWENTEATLKQHKIAVPSYLNS